MSSQTTPSQSSKAATGATGGSMSGSGKAVNKITGEGDPPATQQTIDLNTLTYPQLAQLKKQLDEELTHLTTSYQQLRAAQNKFRDCLAAIRGAKFADIEDDDDKNGEQKGGGGGKGAGEGASTATVSRSTTKISVSAQQQEKQHSSSMSSSSSTILVPLTTSLYVPGTLDTKGSLLVDIGTGFFVSKSSAEALDFYKRKVDELGGNLTKLDGLVQGKGRTVRVVEEALRQKVLASNAPGQGSARPGDDDDA